MPGGPGYLPSPAAVPVDIGFPGYDTGDLVAFEELVFEQGMFFMGHPYGIGAKLKVHLNLHAPDEVDIDVFTFGDVQAGYGCGGTIHPKRSGKGIFPLPTRLELELIAPASVAAGAVEQIVFVVGKGLVGKGTSEGFVHDGQPIVVNVVAVVYQADKADNRLVADIGYPAREGHFCIAPLVQIDLFEFFLEISWQKRLGLGAAVHVGEYKGEGLEHGVVYEFFREADEVHFEFAVALGGKRGQTVVIVALFFRNDAPHNGVGGIFAGIDDHFIQGEGLGFQAKVYAQGIASAEGQCLGLVAHGRGFQIPTRSKVNA